MKCYKCQSDFEINLLMCPLCKERISNLSGIIDLVTLRSSIEDNNLTFIERLLGYFNTPIHYVCIFIAECILISDIPFLVS